MPFDYEDVAPRLNKDGEPTYWSTGPWIEFMAGTRKWPGEVKGPLAEAFPDHDYRYRRNVKPRPSGSRPSAGDISDLAFLKALKSHLHLPDDGQIYPLGVLLDTCLKYHLGRSSRRQPYHRRLRRLWRKGYVRMLRHGLGDLYGRWYILQEQEGWFAKGDRVNQFDKEISLMIERMMK